MKMKIALAALFFLASLTGASSKVIKLTFDGACDGMKLTISGIHVVGVHVNNDCAGGSNVDGGFYGKIGTHKTFIVTDDQGNHLGVAVTYLIEPTGNWHVYYTMDGIDQILGGGGSWTRGLPTAKRNPGSKLKSTLSVLPER